jgi:uncharacterized protein
MKRVKFYDVPLKERLEAGERIAACLAEETEVMFAFLYGSFVSEPLFRDIDLGVYVAGIEPSQYYACENRLTRLIEDAVGFLFPVDVKIINAAPTFFCFEVIRGKLIFSRDEELLVDFLTRTAREHLDMASLRHHYLREAMA